MLPNFSGSKRIYYLTSIRKIEKELIKLIESKENKSKIIKCIDIGPINFRFLVNDFMRLEKDSQCPMDNWIYYCFTF